MKDFPPLPPGMMFSSLPRLNRMRRRLYCLFKDHDWHYWVVTGDERFPWSREEVDYYKMCHRCGKERPVDPDLDPGGPKAPELKKYKRLLLTLTVLLWVSSLAVIAGGCRAWVISAHEDARRAGVLEARLGDVERELQSVKEKLAAEPKTEHERALEEEQRELVRLWWELYEPDSELSDNESDAWSDIAVLLSDDNSKLREVRQQLHELRPARRRREELHQELWEIEEELSLLEYDDDPDWDMLWFALAIWVLGFSVMPYGFAKNSNWYDPHWRDVIQQQTKSALRYSVLVALMALGGAWLLLPWMLSLQTWFWKVLAGIAALIVYGVVGSAGWADCNRYEEKRGQLKRRLHFEYLAEALEQRLEAEPENKSLWSQLAAAYAGAERRSDAIAVCEKRAAADQESRHSIWASLAHTYIRPPAMMDRYGRYAPGFWQGYKDALVVWHRAVEMYPDEPGNWLGLAEASRFLNRWDDAMAACKKAIELAPDGASGWSQLGETYEKTKRWEDAIAAREQAAKVEPEWTSTWTDLGSTCVKVGRVDRAIEAFKKAVKLNPRDSWAWSHLGDAYEAAGRYRDAVRAYDGALKEEPDNGDAKEGLREVNRKLEEQSLSSGSAPVVDETEDEELTQLFAELEASELEAEGGGETEGEADDEEFERLLAELEAEEDTVGDTHEAEGQRPEAESGRTLEEEVEELFGEVDADEDENKDTGTEQA